MGFFSGITKLVSNVVSAPVKLAEKVVSTVSNVAAKVDDVVNDSIPGGWATVAAVAGGAALLSGGAGGGSLLGGAGTGGTAVGNAAAGGRFALMGSALPATAGGGAAAAAAGGGLLSTAGNFISNLLPSSVSGAASSVLDFAKANPSLTSTLIGGAVSAIGSKNAPTSSTTTSNIDPQIKAEYLANLDKAKTTAADLGVRKFADFSPNYGAAEDQVRNLGIGGKGQKTTDEAARLAAIEAGYTPQQIAAAQANRANVQDVSGQTGSQYMSAYQNPFEDQVVQGALGDIERTRQMQEQENMAKATQAKAFGGSRQGIVTGMTNEAALRQAGSTASGLRQAGFNTAAQLGQSDAARQLQAQMANQGVSLTLEQANAQLRQQAALANQQAGIAGANVRQNAIGQMGQLGNQQQNLGLSGANAVMLTELQRQQLEQQRLDAQRNLGSERLGITSGALGMNIPNLGMSSTTPLYNNTAGNFLSGALTGGYIGSLLDPNRPRKPGDLIMGP